MRERGQWRDDEDEDGGSAFGPPEPTLLEKALARGREAIVARDAAGLRAASAIDKSWVEASWPQGIAQAATLALPEAARTGWAEGIEVLRALGADPFLADANRGGWGMSGHAPLSDALARGHWEAAEALVRAGAEPQQEPKSIVWAAAYRAHREGPAEGARVALWARERGFNPWASEAVAASCGPEFLLAGSARSDEPEALEAFERALFEGYIDGPNASHALWCHVFSAAGGSDKGAWLCELFLSSASSGADPQARAVDLLSWALKGGCPSAARSAARALPEDARDWAGFGGSAIEAAAGDPVNLGDKEPPAERVRAALGALWSERGERLASRPRDMERVCYLALKTGRSALFETLMALGPSRPEAVLSRWEREASSDERWGRDARALPRLECLAPMMAKLLANDAGAEGEARARQLHERFIQGSSGSRYSGWRGASPAPEFSESLAKAQRLVFDAQSKANPPRRSGPSRI